MVWENIEFIDFVGGVYFQRQNKEWYQNLLSYFRRMYTSIERRLIETFPFVDCHPRNARTFSYEFGSILRDAGSCFGSVMDTIVRADTRLRRELNINHYTKWLSTSLMHNVSLDGKFDSVELAGAELSINWDRRLLGGFLPHKSLGHPPRWWNAYNKVKHSDPTQFYEGSLENCLDALAALACLWHICEFHSTKLHLFRRIGVCSPESFSKERMFRDQRPNPSQSIDWG